MMSKELEYTRKPDGGLAEHIEELEAIADGDAVTTELLMLLIELRSLRKQLAELKALEPFCHVFLHPDGPLFNGIVSDSCAGHAGVIPLFTAAKPAED